MAAYTHVLREIDTGEEHFLRYPGRTLIGRARVNDIKPHHGSISKQHAVLELSGDPTELFSQAVVEDLHTRNGTFVGHPDRLNVITGKRPLKMGEYIKFGDCQNLFIFEAVRNPDPEPQPSSPVGRSQEGAISPLRHDERGDSVFDQHSEGGVRDLDRGFSQAGTVAGTGGPRLAQNGSSMNISINYPADPTSQRQAVSIQIDPRDGPSSTQAPSVLSPSRVSFEDGGQPGRRPSPSKGVVSALGELDLSGDFGSSRSGVLAAPQGSATAAPRFGGSLSLDARPRAQSPPSPERLPPASPLHGPPPPSAQGTRQMSPVTILTEKERADAEKLRQSLSEGIRATNQVLAGVIKFDDWKLHARKIIGDSQRAVQIPVDHTFTRKEVEAEIKTAEIAAVDDTKEALAQEVARELAAEKPLPLEATMTGRLSAAMAALRSLPMVCQGDTSARASQGGEYDRSSIHACIEHAVDDILSAVETPLGMALEGLDAAWDEDCNGGIADSRQGRVRMSLPQSPTTGKVVSLRSAVSKLKGLDVFFENMGPDPILVKSEEYPSQNGTGDMNWWQSGRSSNGYQTKSLNRPPGNLSELIQSVELGGPGDPDGKTKELAPASTLSKDQLDQITKYVVLSVIAEDIQPVLDRISEEKSMSRTKTGVSSNSKKSLHGTSIDISEQPVGLKHSDVSDLEQFVNKLSTSFTDFPKKRSVKNELRNASDLDAEMSADGELRLSSAGSKGGHIGGLHTSKLPPPGRGTQSPRTSINGDVKRSSAGILLGGSIGAQSPRDNMSMSVEHIEQLTAVNEELEVLEKKHKEEMERMVSEAAQDRLKMQNSSEKERLALEETRRREKEMLEAEMEGQRNALLQERERVVAEAEQAHQTMVQYVTYKVVTRMLDLYRIKVQSAFKRWAFMASTYNSSRDVNATRIKQLKRVLNVVCNGVTRQLHKAFRKWTEGTLRVALQKATRQYLGSQQELLRRRDQIKASSEQLRDIAKGSDVYASLLAEKALNRELSHSNIELYDTLNDTQLRILEMAKIPTAEGKKLVRDVIMTREGELSRSRREVRALRERIDHLEGTITGTKAAAAEGNRQFSASSDQSKYRGGALSGGLEVPGYMTSFMDPSAPPNGSEHRHDSTRTTLEAIDQLAPAEQKRKQALSIILMELTRLRKVNAEFNASKRYLSDTIAKHLAKISEMETVSQVLQQRLSEKSRREASILSYVERNLDADQLRAFNVFMSDLDGTPIQDMESDVNTEYDRWSQKDIGRRNGFNEFWRGDGDEPVERSRSAGSKDKYNSYKKKNTKNKRRPEYQEEDRNS